VCVCVYVGFFCAREVSLFHYYTRARTKQKQQQQQQQQQFFVCPPFFSDVWERHRHRYEVRPDCVPHLQAAGLCISGTDERNQRMEIVELSREGEGGHPFFFSCQYHPEFQSHPHRPSPPFHGFVLAASGQGSQIGVATGATSGLKGGSPPRPQAEGGGLDLAPPPGGGGGASLSAPTPHSPARPVRSQAPQQLPDLPSMNSIAPGEGRMKK